MKNRKIYRWLWAIPAGLVIIIGAILCWTYLNKEMVFTKAKEAVGRSLNGGELDIDDFRFIPFSDGFGLTFALMGISLRDSLYSEHRAPLLKAERLSVRFNIGALVSGNWVFRELKLTNGEVNLFTRSDGYTNLSMFDKKHGGRKQEKGNLFEKVKKLTLENTRVNFSDSLKGQYIGGVLRQVQGQLQTTRTGWEGQLEGAVFYEQLTFNAEKGGFLKERETATQLAFRFLEKTHLLEIINPSRVKLATGETIRIGGSFDLEAPHGEMRLHFDVDRIGVRMAGGLLADSIAVKIEEIGIDPFVKAGVTVAGRLGRPKPRVDVSFVTDTFSYEVPIGFFRGMRATGTFTNQADSTLPVSKENTRVVSNGMRGFFERLPVEGNLSISDFSDPIASIKLTVKADSASLNSILDPSRYQVGKGSARVDLVYNGSLTRFYHAAADSLNGSMRGQVTMRNLTMSYLPQGIRLHGVNSLVTFTEKRIDIRRLEVYDNQNHMFIKGYVEDLFKNLLGSPRPVKAYVDIAIPEWKLNWIKVLANQGEQQQKKARYRFSQVVDTIIENLEVVATLEARKLYYNQFQAENVKGKLSTNRQGSTLDRFTLDAFGGNVTASGILHRPGGEYAHSYVNVKGKVSGANVKNVFYSFNNFGQQAFTSENIKGQLDATFQFASYLDKEISLIPSSMEGVLDFSFTKGNVVNFGPFMKMKKLIFKNRPLEDVKFAPIRNKFVLKGQEISISKMQIESNVLTLFLEGIYSFGTKTDLGIQLPLQNLKKRGADYQLQEYGADSLSSVYLRAVDENGEVNIKLDSKRTQLKRRQRRMLENEKK